MTDEPQDAIERLRTELLAQMRDLYDQIAQLRADMRELRLRNERLESNRRRL